MIKSTFHQWLLMWQKTKWLIFQELRQTDRKIIHSNCVAFWLMKIQQQEINQKGWHYLVIVKSWYDSEAIWQSIDYNIVVEHEQILIEHMLRQHPGAACAELVTRDVTHSELTYTDEFCMDTSTRSVFRRSESICF